MTRPEKVSIHGGHSGQFCNHASDNLEDIIQAYIAQGFSWVGITEHVPAPTDGLLYEDQREQGLTPEFLLEDFGAYMSECRRLQHQYRSQIRIFAAMEIETYSGYAPFVDYLATRFEPDYIVGSVHFVNDLNFDYSEEMYWKTADSVGGVEEMYLEYFDLQFDMLTRIRPAVVGHFDLVRLFDPDYSSRLEESRISQKIRRNLELIKELGLIMDFNLRALAKGSAEPYIAPVILNQVKELGIPVVPGDDSHGVASVGNFLDQGIQILLDHGVDTHWRLPVP